MKCLICGKEIKDYSSRIKLRKTCSKSCLSKLTWTGRKHRPEVIQKMRKSFIWKNIDECIDDYKKGLTIKEVAEKNNYNKNTLRTIFKRLGVEMRRGGNKKGYIPWNYGKEYLAIRGKNHPNWKGGITSLNQKIRHCIEYYNWMRSIMKRDDYTCQKCGKKGNGNLEVDHYPRKFSDIMHSNKISSYEEAQKCDELWNINNGRTLCLKCHNRTKRKIVRSRFKKVGVTNTNQDSP